jgi:DNA polymerase elongation subunit (family B)
MNWIEIPAGNYTVRKGKDTISRAQIEIGVKYDKFISHAPEGEWQKLAPLRILSFDIECAGRKGIFPEAQVDPVIQIANMVTRQGKFCRFYMLPAVKPNIYDRREHALHSERFLPEQRISYCRFASQMFPRRGKDA